MSEKDSRLGANPLSWVDPGASVETRNASSGQEREPEKADEGHDTATHTEEGRLFSPATITTEEDVMGKSKVKISQNLETAQVVKHLMDLAKSLETGVVKAEAGDETLVLRVPDFIEFQIKASRKKDKAKCSVELSWLDDGSNDEVFKLGDS